MGVKRQTWINWIAQWRDSPLAVLLPLALPLVLMFAFVIAVKTFIGPRMWFGMWALSVPYAVLWVMALGALAFRRIGLAWLIAVLPMLLLACVHAALIFDHINYVATHPRVPGQNPDSVSPEQAMNMVSPFFTLMVLVVIGVWAGIVLARVVHHARLRSAGKCAKCRYDRTGLAPGAACPECGAAALSAPANP